MWKWFVEYVVWIGRFLCLFKVLMFVLNFSKYWVMFKYLREYVRCKGLSFFVVLMLGLVLCFNRRFVIKIFFFEIVILSSVWLFNGILMICWFVFKFMFVILFVYVVIWILESNDIDIFEKLVLKKMYFCSRLVVGKFNWFFLYNE